MAADTSTWQGDQSDVGPEMLISGCFGADLLLLEQVAALCGIRRLHDAGPALSDRDDALADGIARVMMLRLSSDPDRTAQDLSIAARYLVRNGIRAVVWTDLEQLDMADAILPQGQCRYLVDPEPVDLILAISEAVGQRTMASMFDSSRADDVSMLGRMSEQLAMLADTLNRMARQQEDATEQSARDRPVSFRPAPQSAPLGFVPAMRRAEEDIDPRDVREIIRLRRLREQFFDADLFGDPAWDMLLDLLAARLEHRKVSVSSLCIAAAVPATTALRWIQRMTTDGWLERHADPHDARRVHIALSEDAATRMADYLRAELASRKS